LLLTLYFLLSLLASFLVFFLLSCY